MRIAGKDLCRWLGHRWLPCAWEGWDRKRAALEPLAVEWECFRCREKTR